MANFIILRSNKAVLGLGWLCVMMLVHQGAAGYEFIVGGQKGWSVPSDTNFNPFNQWAEKSRFQIGDSIVFNYQSGQDSVLYVKSEDYATCNTGSPYAKFSDGHTVIKLIHSGPHFFISGNKNNCLKNEKVTVIVLANRNNQNSSNTNQTNTASPPSPQSSSAPPPAGIVESNPTPAPVSVSYHHHNAATSILINSAASIGTFMASLLLILSL
ncbi:hypothetical protein TanjilG_19666 [Lupinus angustifolius]|uniref:Phytocyanin domain-containing protein n=1 Tax=Lupinus angustifolius TaxID=3871 RepID=A0A1J7HFF9_LUPAN|nr:PREDICTED: early nodulin-like protein 3 [Lupinus angustifolius]OIV99170.1 hypothetical protein TanjilG_19666 [Lupinus angustifolius]